jgi:HD-GYP domain-containing protein (c-di-GMP phosphodiesterase class II)
MALALGAEAYETLRTKAVERVRNETHADAVKWATASYQEELAANAATADVQIKRLTGERQKYEQALQVAQARLEALEQSATTLRQSARQEARESFQELLEAKEKQISQLEQTLEKQVGTVCGKMDTLQNSITKTFSSSKEKGSFGEGVLESFLKKAFDCDIQVISKEAQSADIRMIRGPECEYLWEAKNYTRMVTSEEVEKFRRDLRLHPEVRAGCLVSLRTGIVGRTRGGDIDMEFLEDGRCILYLSNFMSRDDPVFYLQTLRPFFQVLEATCKPIKEDSESVRELQQRATLIANLLRGHATSVAKHRNSIVTHRKRVDTMFTEFQGYVMESETQLKTVLKLAVGGDDADRVQMEVDTELPRIFKKPRLSDYQGRAKEFLTWFLEVTEPCEGSHIEVKELVDRATGFSDKFIRELREEIFDGAAWAKGARHILGLAWKMPAKCA